MPGILNLLLGLTDEETRAQSIRDLAIYLECDALIFFIEDRELNLPLPAPGFQQTLPQGLLWRTFLSECSRNGEHAGILPFPDAGTFCPASGIKADDGSVLILLGSTVNLEKRNELAPLLPLVSAALRKERTALNAGTQAAIERQAANRSSELAARLDAVARENAHLFREAGKQIADRQRAEVEQQKFGALIENSSDFIAMFSADGKALFINSYGRALVGLKTAEEAETKSFRDFFPEHLHAFVDEVLVPAVQREGRWTGETQFQDFASGSAICVHQTNFMVRDRISDGGSAILATITRDITAAKQAEERLRQTAKLESLGILAGGIAHDFNNLLTGIMGNASLLEDVVPPANSQLVKDLLAAAERAAQLTDQMLAYSGRSHFIVKPIDLACQVREIIILLAASIPKNVRIDFHAEDQLPLIDADSGQLQQVIMNLVLNGAEAIGPPGGTVAVRVATQNVTGTLGIGLLASEHIRPGLFVVLEIRDNGSGMDAATQAKIFDPFFTTKFTGRGLGLAAVQGIVRGHKGAIEVNSRPGQGSTFKVFFPVSERHLTTAQAEAPKIKLRGAGTVLVIDDELLVQKVARTTLERYGYTVLSALNGEEGIEVFERMWPRIAVVVLDMTMPVMAGEETLVRLKQIRPEVRVIASSGYNEVEAQRRFGPGTIDSFLQKPYKSTELASKVAHEMMAQRDHVEAVKQNP